ncbi:fibrinogen-like YCDxxxxGGGW domain-containing protein [Nannocystis sp. ILAH1]|uniref:fibrinogen-like YCDxxxxGGGW domain-containing protein n=1 Tax=Nannocystis sp. ILAH1 TaxID=2996789 RepID=UPI00226F8AB0|nr:fibrinogen-like YCDxxxxGGGW domain-containing protein [Nannocystis sp. ILAH1]MCY0993503.1 fibrinogen-like YCDxxxxGGGW domain-containing protein [Nannocystis sp. ILAH1]
MRVQRSELVAGVVVAALVTGCLDSNPWFEEPTASGAASGTTQVPTTGGTTAAPLPTSSTSAESTTTTTETTTTGTTTTGLTADTEFSTSWPLSTSTTEWFSTGDPWTCGNGVLEGPEQCDEGADNSDKGACTTLCTTAECSDGFVHAGVEMCDDGNFDPSDGCVACLVPHTCKEILDNDPQASDGQHYVDPDGPEPMPLIPVYCDMKTAGGGWSLLERSPRSDPIGRALFKDAPENPGDPLAPRYRMPRMAMGVLAIHSTAMRLDCGGGDHLVTAAQSLFAGEFGPPGCANAGPVLYQEAEFKQYKLTNVQLCTVFVGLGDGQCPGAWSIDEENQYDCLLTAYPWAGNNEAISPPSADAFAVDPQSVDPDHDCHKPGAMRRILVR